MPLFSCLWFLPPAIRRHEWQRSCDPEYEPELFVHQKSKSTLESARTVLEQILPALEALPAWDDEALLNVQTALSEQMGVKKSVVMWPVRIALAGKAVTPGGAVEIAWILGKEESLARLNAGIAKLTAE